MQIILMYTGDDGRTHIQDLTPEELGNRIAAWTVGPVTVAIPNSPPNRPGGFFADHHPYSSQPGLLVMCTGVSEYDTADGWRRMMPGDAVIFADFSGEGHSFYVSSLESRIGLSVKLSSV